VSAGAAAAAALEALLAALAPGAAGHIAAAAADPRTPAPPLPAPEAAAVAAAIPARRAEFAAGRAAARAALARLGLGAVALPPGAGRAPCWPAGIAGAITHTATLALAAVARTGPLAGLGIDAEPAGALAPDLWGEVFTVPERAALAALPGPARAAAALAAFTAKEAFFKAQFPLTGRMPGFADIAVSATAPGRLALAAATPAGAAALAALPAPPLAGTTTAAGHTLAAVVVPAGGRGNRIWLDSGDGDATKRG